MVTYLILYNLIFFTFSSHIIPNSLPQILTHPLPNPNTTLKKLQGNLFPEEHLLIVRGYVSHTFGLYHEKKYKKKETMKKKEIR